MLTSRPILVLPWLPDKGTGVGWITGHWEIFRNHPDRRESITGTPRRISGGLTMDSSFSTNSVTSPPICVFFPWRPVNYAEDGRRPDLPKPVI